MCPAEPSYLPELRSSGSREVLGLLHIRRHKYQERFSSGQDLDVQLPWVVGVVLSGQLADLLIGRSSRRAGNSRLIALIAAVIVGVGNEIPSLHV